MKIQKLPTSIKEIQSGLLKKEFSAVGIVDFYLGRINKLNKKINAFLTVSAKSAYADAKRVDSLIKTAGKNALSSKPLLGVPIAHKDLFLTKGIRTTAGAKVLSSYIPAYSGTVVEKLKKAGTILLGKTNLDAWAHGSSGENSDFGPTKNPWKEEYVPGGSSSGSAAGVASGLCLAATGTDTGGSIRLPANFCGVVGFKPTYGAVSRYGVIAMASSLDAVGHFTTNVVDAKSIFAVTKGEDGKDSTVKNGKWQMANGKSRKLKLGIPKEYLVDGIDKEILKNFEEVKKTYQKMGVHVIDISLPHTKYGISVYYIIQPAEVSSNLGRYDGIRFGEKRNVFGEEAKRRIMLGTYVLSSGYYDAYYLKAMKVRTKIIEDFDRVFNPSAAGVDAIICPVTPSLPFKIGENNDDPMKLYLADILTVGVNIAGLPGLAVPSGFSKKGLPLGFQLIGPRFSEETIFTLGRLYEDNSEERKLADDI